MESRKIYIAGKITGDENYLEKFQEAALFLRKQGFRVMSPSCLPYGFDYNDYLHVCFSMIDVCDTVYFLKDWKDSNGATLEHTYAEQTGKEIKEA